MTGIDNLGLVNEVTKVISSNMHVNIKNISFETDDGIFSGKITVVVKNNTLVNKLMNNLKKITGINRKECLYQVLGRQWSSKNTRTFRYSSRNL